MQSQREKAKLIASIASDHERYIARRATQDYNGDSIRYLLWYRIGFVHKGLDITVSCWFRKDGLQIIFGFERRNSHGA